MPTFTATIQHYTGDPASTARKERDEKSIRIGKEETKLPSFFGMWLFS